MVLLICIELVSSGPMGRVHLYVTRPGGWHLSAKRPQQRQGTGKFTAVPARSISPVSPRHMANKSLRNSQLPWWTIAQITSGRGVGRPLSYNCAFLFPRSSRRVVLYLRSWSNTFKELHSNAVVPKEHARSSPRIVSEEPREPRIQILWNMHSLTKGVEAKSHILHFSIHSTSWSLWDEYKNINHIQPQNLINECVEKGPIKS